MTHWIKLTPQQKENKMITIQEYNEISIRGIQANQRVRGVTRGGYVFQGFFYYPASINVGILKVKAENYTTEWDNEDTSAMDASRLREG